MVDAGYDGDEDINDDHREMLREIQSATMQSGRLHPSAMPDNADGPDEESNSFLSSVCSLPRGSDPRHIGSLLKREI